MTDAIAVAAATLLGLLVGSFANVAIHRWPRGGSVATPSGSYCPSCEDPVAPRDNIPVLSWLILRGRCRACGEGIAARYPLVEVATAGLFAATAAVHGATWSLPALLASVWVLVVASAIDLEHRIIPNKLTYRAPFVLLALLVVAAVADGQGADLARAAIAGVALPAFMLALSELFRLLRGQAGIGMGDVKLAASLGLVVGYLGGWELVIFFYGALVTAMLVVTVLLVTGRAKVASRIPFGPYLSAGALIAVLAGEPLADALASWLGVA